jgi:hypothetical protein
MPFGPNDGQRSNVRMRDIAVGLTTQFGGSSITHNTAISTTSPFNDGQRHTSGIKMSSMYAKRPYNDSDGNNVDYGFHHGHINGSGNFGFSANDNALEHSGVNQTLANSFGPNIFKHQNGRYRSGTGAPSNITQAQTGSINMGNLVGVGLCCLTQDTVGHSRGINQYTSGTSTMSLQAKIQPPNNVWSGSSTKGMKPGLSVSGNVAAPSPNDSSNIGNIGYSVYTSTHTNQWMGLSLNTKCCTGDRIVVIAHGGGGNMYNFSTNGPIYLRNENNNTIGANVSTLQAPHKNQTGDDDNLAIYTAIATQDGATRVLVNPFHSSAQPYIWHVFVFKGPSVFIDSIQNQTTKYTSYTSTAQTQAISTLPNFTEQQRFFIGVTSSPFYSNRLPTTPLTPNYGDGHDMIVYPSSPTSSRTGSFYTSICNYTGGTRGISSSDKFGFTVYNPVMGFYAPNFEGYTPSGHHRWIWISGRRGPI